MDSVPVKWVENDLDKKLENGWLNGNYFATTASITANKIIKKKVWAQLREQVRERQRDGGESGCEAGGRLNTELLINELIKDTRK